MYIAKYTYILFRSHLECQNPLQCMTIGVYAMIYYILNNSSQKIDLSTLCVLLPSLVSLSLSAFFYFKTKLATSSTFFCLVISLATCLCKQFLPTKKNSAHLLLQICFVDNRKHLKQIACISCMHFKCRSYSFSMMKKNMFEAGFICFLNFLFVVVVLLVSGRSSKVLPACRTLKKTNENEVGKLERK